MHREGPPIPGKSTVILPIFSLCAIALSVKFAGSPLFEPIGLLGFALFCLGSAALVRSVWRPQHEPRATASIANSGDLHQSATTARYRIDPARKAADQVAG